MRIVFFTQEDPFYVRVFFERFLRSYSRIEEICAVVISQPMGKKSPRKLAMQMLDFYGPFDFLRTGMKYVFFKAAGKFDLSSPGGRKAYTIKQLVRSYGIELLERSDLNSKPFLETIRRYEADLFISVASPVIFRSELIGIPKVDCINIHSAPLPKYRGMLPSFWQLYHGEKEAGITVHRIDTGIDTGDVVARRSVPVSSKETLDSLIRKTKIAASELMIEVIDAYRRGCVRYQQMGSDGSYFTFPGHRDVREFKRRGGRFF